MKYLFHLGHPAHFHLFKNVIKGLISNGEEVKIAIKKKDVLETLLTNEGFSYYNLLPEGKKTGKLNLLITQIKQIVRLFKFAKKEKIEILCGTSASIGIVGKILKIPNYNFNEDDAEVVPLYAKMAYPFATKIFAPDCCSVGKYENKKISYSSYHELAYLHPEHFTKNEEIALKYVDLSMPFYLIRFAKLTAHHDTNIKGISLELAKKIIQKLETKGNIYISSEVNLSKDLKKYELKIAPQDIHHVMAFSSIFIGDSQTMSAESAVLGVPFIRISDFVNKLSYLSELENKYQLGFGFYPSEENKILSKLDELLKNPIYTSKINVKKMLEEKIELSSFILNQLLKQKH